MLFEAYLTPEVISISIYLLGAATAGLLVPQLQKVRYKGQVWLVGLNSNNKTAIVRRVKADREGYQVKDGPYVKFEGDFAYIDRKENRPTFVYNEDTGFCLKATTGEAQEMDGMVYSAALLSHDWEAVQRSHGAIPWVALAVVGVFGVVVLVGTVIYLVMQFIPKGGG